MLSGFFGKRKLNEDKIANVIVNSLTQAVDHSFEEIVHNIQNDAEFVKTPQLSVEDSDKFLVIVLVGNLNYLSRYFSNTEEMALRGRIIEKFGKMFDLSYDNTKKIIEDYENFIFRVNHPSKNIIYGMSKAVFYKYKLGQYQDEYFAQLDAPNPIFLKRMDTLMENFIWDWNAFFEKHKFVPLEA